MGLTLAKFNMDLPFPFDWEGSGLLDKELADKTFQIEFALFVVNNELMELDAAATRAYEQRFPDLVTAQKVLGVAKYELAKLEVAERKAAADLEAAELEVDERGVAK